MEDLDCEVCCERFDLEKRRPKLMECGHTLCLACAHNGCREQNVTCPMDRQEFRVTPIQLKDNFYLLSKLEVKDYGIKGSAIRCRFWCLECNMQANRRCLGKHDLCSMQKARTKQITEDSKALECKIALQRQELDQLQALGRQVQASVERQLSGSTSTHEALEDLLRRARIAVEGPGPVWEEVSRAVREAAVTVPTIVNLQHELGLLNCTGTCRLQLDAGPDGLWSGSLKLSGDITETEEQAVLRFLLYLLRRKELLLPMRTRDANADSKAVTGLGWLGNLAGEGVEGVDPLAAPLGSGAGAGMQHAQGQGNGRTCVRQGQGQAEEDGDDPSRAERTFRFTLHRLSKVRDYQLSPEFFVRRLPWRLLFKPSSSPGSSSRDDGSRHLGLFLVCAVGIGGDAHPATATASRASHASAHAHAPWSCFARAELRLLSHREDVPPISRGIQHLFNRKEYDWGFARFVSWAVLRDPERGFLKEDAITVEAHVQAEAPLMPKARRALSYPHET